jgi:hypothetical protein
MKNSRSATLGARLVADGGIGQPGRVGDGGHRIAEGDQRQRCRQPAESGACRRLEQAAEADPQQHQGHADGGPARHAVGPGADEGVDQCVEQPQRQQQAAEQAERESGVLGVETRHVEVDRQRGKGQRHAEQTEGGEPDAAGVGSCRRAGGGRRGVAGVHACTSSN